MTTSPDLPDDVGADAPADQESLPGGRIVVVEPRPAAPAEGPYPEGVARMLGLIGAHVPREQVDAVWSFPAVRREGREYGVAVVSRREPDAAKTRVYRARYTLELKGEKRGTATLELEETAATPPEMVERVIAGVARRADEAGDAELIDLEPWKSGQ